MEQLKLHLSRDEYSALVRLAEAELRPVADQARVVLREALRRRGVWQPSAAARAEQRDA